MIEDALFIILFIAVAGLLSNRLYVGLSEKALNVKGALYSRADTPLAYWLTMGFAAIGSLFGFVMTAVMIAHALGQIQ